MGFAMIPNSQREVIEVTKFRLCRLEFVVTGTWTPNWPRWNNGETRPATSSRA